MKAIIFGINSQDGFYLSELLGKKAVKVIGVSRSQGEWLQGSISDPVFTENLIKSEVPDFIFHLAANSTTKHSALFENNHTINNATLYILEAVKQYSPKTKVFITGSGLQFINNGLPIKETDEFDANSAYSLSRIQSVYTARYYRSMGIATYVGYLFHHESPHRKDHHVSKYISGSVKSIKEGQLKKIILGDISVQKEWAFAEDIAEGIYKLVSQNNVFEATIGTGITYTIEDWLVACFSVAKLKWQEHVDLTNNNFKAEYPILVSNPETMNRLGWKAKTSFADLAKIMMQ